MKAIFYKFSLLMMSLILVTGSVANASNPCCCTSGEMPEEMSDSNMPCHDNSEMVNSDIGDSNSNISCEACECATCVKTSFFNMNIESEEFSVSKIQFFEKETVYSAIYDTLYQPPKQTS